MNNLPTIQRNKKVNIIKKLKVSRLICTPSSHPTITNVHTPNNINAIKNSRLDKLAYNNMYDYFNTNISHSTLEKYIRANNDEKFLFFLKYGIIHRFEGECDIIYLEIPQIPKKLIVYRLPHSRNKSLEILNLNNRDLPLIPLFENEDKLKYLSMETNNINKIENLVSLDNLVYLNLYENNIREIENLNNVKKLKILLLGRNNINQIKNLNSLTELETLDLHNNKIKNIEGLQSLKKLKEINLSNNLLCFFDELIHNKSLENINISKNLIATIPNLSNGVFDSVKILNLSKNLINKINYLEELSKLTSLKELYLDFNPIFKNLDAIPIINKLPTKDKIPIMQNSPKIKEKVGPIFKKKEIGIIDNNKSNNTIHDNFRAIQKFKKANDSFFRLNKMKKIINYNQAFSTNNLKKKERIIDEEKSNKGISSLISTISVRNLSHDLSQSKISFSGKLNLKSIITKDIPHKIQIKELKAKNSKDNLSLSINSVKMEKDTKNDIKKDMKKNIKKDKIIKINIKFFMISKQWIRDYENIIINGYNGYSNKKSKETYINQGYIEVEGENNNCLNLFGNCLKILTKKELYDHINILKFNYFNFDLITCKKYFEYIKAFKNIKKLHFNYNNIYSFYQLIKLEYFENLENLSIVNNEICCSKKFAKLFLIYRIDTIETYNNELIRFEEKILSNKIFNTFDNLILLNEKRIKNEHKNKDIEEEKRKNISDKNLLYGNAEKKFLMWNYAKKNLANALFSIFTDDEAEDETF